MALSFAIIGVWNVLDPGIRADVNAINADPTPANATVDEPLIDGFGGDPGVRYRYVVNGQAYTGFDIGNKTIGNVAALKKGQSILIVYARDRPGVSCLAGSTDCPNEANDPETVVILFWILVVLVTIGFGFFSAVHRVWKWHRRKKSSPAS
jgi:hypothetical protein